MLAAVAGDLGRAGALVSFNGKSFDAPVLETRYLFHRLDWFASGQPHLDVLHPARRFWKEDECSLMALEQQVLGAWRKDDVPASRSPSGTSGSCVQAIRNRSPRCSSTTVSISSRSPASTSRLLEIVCGGPDHAENAREALALGHVYARARDADRAIGAYERAVTLSTTSRSRRAGLVMADALRALAVAYRRARRYDDAARCWSALIDCGCPGGFEREAVEALAIHHEHRRRDLESARLFALKNMAGTGAARERWRDTARRRLARIERKIARRDARANCWTTASGRRPRQASWPCWPPPPSCGSRTSARRTSS